jgi:hypothetical protein
MNEAIPIRPLPVPDALTEPFCTAVKAHRFILPSCTDCGRTHFYPRSLCPHCGSAAIEWVEASGRGTVYSFTLVQRAPSAAFAAEVPYAVAVVALEEGPHLMTSIVGCEPSAITIGMPVVVDYLDIAESSLPVFRPPQKGGLP